MSVSDKLTRLSDARNDIIDALATKGVSATGHGFEAFPTDIINIPADTPTLETKTKTYTPTESQQTETITPDTGYDGLSSVDVTVNAVSSTYVGSGIARKSSTDLTVSGDTITAPAGYYSSSASKSVSSMTLPTSASSSATSGYTSKATISRSSSNQYINIPPGYNSSGCYYLISSVADLVLPTSASSSATSGYTSKATISRSTSDQYINIGTGYNSAGAYYKISATPNMTLPTSASSISSGTSKATIGRSTSNQYINIPTGYNDTASYYTISAVANGSATPATSISGTSATVSTGTNTLTLTKSVSNTPVVSAGYISSGTAGNSSVSLTANVTTKAAETINTSSSDQTIASGTYLTGLQTIKAVTTNNIIAGNIKNGVTVTVGDANNASRILSVTGTYSGGTTYPDATISAGTYRFGSISYPGSTGTYSKTININFTSYGNSYTSMTFTDTYGAGYSAYSISYKNSGGTSTTVYSNGSWTNIRYRYITISSSTTVSADEAVVFFTNAQKTSYNLIRSVDFSVNTSSTSAATATTIALTSDEYTSAKILVVQVRDKAGKRKGYFLGSDSYFMNYYKANNGTTTLTYAGRIIHYVNSSGSYQQYPQGTSSGYGVYGYSISSSGSLIIRSRYSSNYSLTINGTFNAKVYTLDYTLDSGGNPYSFSF